MFTGNDVLTPPVGFYPSSTDVVITPSVIVEFDGLGSGTDGTDGVDGEEGAPLEHPDTRSTAANTVHIMNVIFFMFLLR